MRKNVRDSKFKILRIVSMIFITACHFSLYGNWIERRSVHNYQFNILGQVGVYIFVMISGYFLGKRESNLIKSWKRVRPLWKKTCFFNNNVNYFTSGWAADNN